MNSKCDFSKQMEQKVQAVEAVLQEYLPKQKGYQSVIMEAMCYSLLAGGKRLRPLLMSETARLFGEHSPALKPFMAAIEMIHTYSLVHDDLPAMDNDEYRRGRKTTHVVYGENMGILAGDALLNYAFETAFRAFVMDPEESLTIGRALTVLGEKAGIYGMIGGQVIDVKETGHEVSKEILDTIYELKTAALIEASMMIGAILGGASEEEVRMVEQIRLGVIGYVRDPDLQDRQNLSEYLQDKCHREYSFLSKLFTELREARSLCYYASSGVDDVKGLLYVHSGIDKANYDKRTKVLEEYFSNYEVQPGKKINGKLTLGENIGDNGGLNIAFRAFSNLMKTKKLPVIDGFTPEQRFFLAWGRVWAANTSDEMTDYLLKVDPHSPNQARVNGALPHIDAWYDAFNVKKSDKMYVPKSKRAHIW